jgi:hypothetical protein
MLVNVIAEEGCSKDGARARGENGLACELPASQGICGTLHLATPARPSANDDERCVHPG